VLIAVSPKLNACKRRHDLQFFDECVWVEFSIRNGPNLLIGNHYFSPDLKPDIICEFFSHLENKLDTTNYRVILLGDFNVPGFDWERGLPCEYCQFYSKLRGDAIHASTCFLGLGECVDADHSSNILDLVFSNITDLHITFPDTSMVKPDVYHPPLLIELPFIVKTCFKTNELSYFKYACGDYTLLYNILSSYDWSSVYSKSSVDAAVASLNSAVHEAIDRSIPLGFVKGSNCPSWFSRTLRHCILKKNYYYRRFKKNKSNFSF
jgi:hypothetical protein